MNMLTEEQYNILIDLVGVYKLLYNNYSALIDTDAIYATFKSIKLKPQVKRLLKLEKTLLTELINSITNFEDLDNVLINILKLRDKFNIEGTNFEFSLSIINRIQKQLIILLNGNYLKIRKIKDKSIENYNKIFTLEENTSNKDTLIYYSRTLDILKKDLIEFRTMFNTTIKELLDNDLKHSYILLLDKELLNTSHIKRRKLLEAKFQIIFTNPMIEEEFLKNDVVCNPINSSFLYTNILGVTESIYNEEKNKFIIETLVTVLNEFKRDYLNNKKEQIIILKIKLQTIFMYINKNDYLLFLSFVNASLAMINTLEKDEVNTIIKSIDKVNKNLKRGPYGRNI